MQIIDTHTHIYPQKIAEKATQSIGEFYGLKMNCIGDIPSLLASGKEVGVEKFLVHSVAVSPQKVTAINDFVSNATLENNCFTGFMTLHPDMTKNEIDAEINRAVSLGLIGIKLHPDIQTFAIDEDRAKAIYDVNDNRLPILLHTGDRRYSFSNPFRLANIAKLYKKTIFIGAHFGGYSEWDTVDCYLKTPNVFFDTSSSLFLLEKRQAADIINRLGSHRFFFATDFPITTHRDELERFLALPLSPNKQEDILCHNAKRVLNI